MEEIQLSAAALFHAEQSQDLRDLIAEKLEQLQHYDVLAMDRVVAICFLGKSGSLLLASYLDGHADVMTLPALCGMDLYKFFERYQCLSLRDKLIGYPAHAQRYAPFFEGDFAISPAQYYAAAQAIVEFYAEWPPEFLASRGAFFLFVHIAYNMALGRPASSRPLIVYAQHQWDNGLARLLVEDFPQAKFVHTIRDPITLCGQILAERLLPSEPSQKPSEIPPSVNTRAELPEAQSPFRTAATLSMAAFQKLADLLRGRRVQVLSPIHGDRPHFGMESRTLAIRFEELHDDTEETMRDLCDWLGLSYQATLLESTFNGIPWVVTRDGKTWSGRRPEQPRRNSRYISLKDRGLLFALFYENFVAWNYPCPKIFRHAVVRGIVFAALLVFPMKIEIMAAQALFRNRILPALRHGNVSVAINSLRQIVFYRLAIILQFALEFVSRFAHGKTLLALGHGRAPAK